ncbi:MAG: SAM-dependent methyltransferase, partial [Bacteroidaceae bacterium]|nr:SAM-dependent methyltransferase [Bacteroidaceae bacterium]
HRNDDVKTLALQSSRHPDVDMLLALTQIEAWQHATEKLPRWAATEGIIYPRRISMEQCSSQPTALYKASLMGGTAFADLTGGFGIDCSYISRHFDKGYYIERNDELCEIATHNFALLGLHHIEVINSNSEQAVNNFEGLDWIYLDPARRDGAGKKVVALDDCEPDIVALHPALLKCADRIMVKCSPMLDITAACRQLHTVSDIHIVSVNNECKELLFILTAEECPAPTVHCINIKEGKEEKYTFLPDEENCNSFATEVGRFLYEPNASIQKAGCPPSLCSTYSVKKLHHNSNLYTSDELAENFPGRTFEVASTCGFSKNGIKECTGDLKKANITVRNFPETVQQLRKRLKLGDGGDTYLFATTLADGRKVLIRCGKLK